MNNLPPGITQEMIDGHEHFQECLDQPLDAECICLEIIDARAADEADAAYDDLALESEFACQI